MRTFSRIRREGVLPRRWWDRGLIGERVGQPPARGRDSGPKEEGARKKGRSKKANAMGEDAKPGMREIFLENVRQDARRDNF